MAAWAASYAVKVAVDFLVGPLVYQFLPEILIYIYIGLLTGIFEIFIPLFIISKKTEIFKSFSDRIGFGLAFGSFEAIFLGALVMVNYLVAYSLSIQGSVMLSEDIIAAFSFPTETYIMSSLLAFMERVSAIVMHVFAMLLIFAFFYSARLGYLFSAISYKTFIDGMAAFFVFSQAYTGEVVEIFYFALAAVSLVIIWKFNPQLDIGKPVPVEEVAEMVKPKRKRKTK
jgi:uncharacterized membrane protein YhfC